MEGITNNEILYQAVLQQTFINDNDHDLEDKDVVDFVANYVASRYGKLIYL